MRPQSKLSPMGWAVIYALTMPLVVSFLATPKAIQILNHPEWVQAIGSILAILASAAVAMWIDGAASKRLRRESANRDWRHATMAYVLSAQALECLNLCKSYLSGNSDKAIGLANLDTVILALDRVQISDLPDAEFVLDFVVTQRNVVLGLAAYQTLLKSHSSRQPLDADNFAEFERACGVVEARAKSIEARVDQMAAQLNAAFPTSG